MNFLPNRRESRSGRGSRTRKGKNSLPVPVQVCLKMQRSVVFFNRRLRHLGEVMMIATECP